MKVCTVILGAGKSSRMNSNIPKPFHKVANLKLIDWILNLLNSVKIDKKIIVTSKNVNFSAYKNIAEIVVQKNQLGTGDAVLTTHEKLKKFKGIILICFADTPFISNKTILKLISSIKNKNHISITGFRSFEKNSYGKIITLNNKSPMKIIEDKNSKINVELCNGGIMAFDSNIMFDLLNKVKPDKITKEYFLTDVVELAFKRNYKIDLIEVDENEIIGINTRQDLITAEKFAQNKLKNFLLNKGVSILDPSTTYLSYDTTIQKDVIIHPNVVISNGVKIRSGSEIFPFCHLENCIIHKNVSVGPFARIRGNVNLGEGSKIGNFVELKNVVLKKDVKINHLSYIGDTNIGEKTNIGAGTITCNYDGFKKNNTSIGYNAFIGSNSTIIAPINIGNNSTIGAGSVITEDVKKNELAIGRSKQIIKKNKSIVKTRKS